MRKKIAILFILLSAIGVCITIDSPVSHAIEQEVPVGSKLDERVNSNSYTATRSASGKSFSFAYSGSGIFKRNPAPITFHYSDSEKVWKASNISAGELQGDSNLCNNIKALAVPIGMESFNEGDSQKNVPSSLNSILNDLYDNKKPNVTLRIVVKTSFSATDCPQLANKFGKGYNPNDKDNPTYDESVNEKNVAAAYIVLDDQAKNVNEVLGDSISSKITDPHQEKYINRLSQDAKKQAGCTEIGGNYSCDNTIRQRIYQEMVNSCVSRSVDIISNRTIGQESLALLVARCVSENVYGNNSQEMDLEVTLRDLLNYDEIKILIEKAREDALNELLEPSENGETRTCTIEGVGWIVCPAMVFIGGLNDAMFAVIKNFLTIDNKIISTDEATFTAWKIFRDIANVVFVILFMVVIFSQLTSIGVSNYGIKKILPKMIIAVLLINVSFYICQAAVDLSNILGHSLRGLFESVGTNIIKLSEDQSNGISWEILGAAFTGGLTTTIIVGGGAFALYAIGIPGALMFLLSTMMTLLILIGRQAGIILLAAISPVAFAAWLLPNTEEYFKKWWKMFFGLLLVFPIVSVLFGAGALAGSILNSSRDPLMQIAALVVSALPLIMTPSLLKNSIGAMGGIGAKVAGLQSKLSSKAAKASKSNFENRGAVQAWRSGRELRQAKKAAETRKRLHRGVSGGIGRLAAGRDNAEAWQTRTENMAAAQEEKERQELISAAKTKQSALTHQDRVAIAATGMHNGARVSDEERQAAIETAMEKGDVFERRRVLEGMQGVQDKRLRSAAVNAARGRGDTKLYGNSALGMIEEGGREGSNSYAQTMQNSMVQRLEEGAIGNDTMHSDEKTARLLSSAMVGQRAEEDGSLTTLDVGVDENGNSRTNQVSASEQARIKQDAASYHATDKGQGLDSNIKNHWT